MALRITNPYVEDVWSVSWNGTNGISYSYTYSWPETQQNQKEAKVRGLFEVTIVDPSDDTFWLIDGTVSWLVVAKDETSAKLKAVVAASLTGDVDDYDIVIRRLGDVRCKAKIQEVKIIKE